MSKGLRAPVTADLVAFVRALLARRWVRFGIVGGASTLVYVLLGLFFVSMPAIPVLVGNALAYVLSFVVSYLGQCLWTFRTGDASRDLSHRAMLPRFAAIQALGLGLNSAIIWVLMRFGLSYEIAMPAAVLLVPVMVYFLCKYWVFRQRAPVASSVTPHGPTPPSRPTTSEEKP